MNILKPIEKKKIDNLTEIEKTTSNFRLSTKVLQKFLDFYIHNYDNIFSKRFESIDLDRNKVLNQQIYLEFLRNISRKLLYKLI